jgi:hypothetical protein
MQGTVSGDNDGKRDNYVFADVDGFLTRPDWQLPRAIF